MYRHGWIVWYLLLYAPLVLGSLDIIENDSEVICSQGLSDCTMQNVNYLDSNSVKVTDLSPEVKLCCRRHTCALCLLIHVEVDLGKPGEEEDNSGLEVDEDTEETKDNEARTGSVTVRYMRPEALATFKKVEFIVNKARSSEQSTAQISLIIMNAGISYGSLVFIDLPYVQGSVKEVNVPSLEDVCSSDIKTYVQECLRVPIVNFSTNKDNQVELHFPGSESRALVVCLQNELNGTCQEWNRKPIQLEALTPCTCFQAWEGNSQMLLRSRSCPFRGNTALRQNIWMNFTASVDKRHVVNYGTVLWWNVSAPCRLKGEVWPCERTAVSTACTETEGFRQQLQSGSWNQNSNGLWEKTGVFAKINLENHPCVMLLIKINETKYEKGPFCYSDINRGRWSLFAVAVMLILSLTLLITVCLRDFIKKSVWSWCHGGFVKPVHKAHVLVISPPDSGAEVSAAVSSLGSLLCSRGFSATVDQWSHKAQLSLGPLPWSHSQLLGLDSQCDRVVLVLTPKAVERAQTWSRQDSTVIVLQHESPYSDVFRASLFAIQACKNQGQASECFVLVTLDSLWTDAKICHKKLPEILQGLPLFHFPSQSKSLLSNLCVGTTQRQPDKAKWTFALS